MSIYSAMTKTEKEDELKRLTAIYEGYKAEKLSLDISRGKPSKAQLDLSMPMLDVLDSDVDYMSENGIDT